MLLVILQSAVTNDNEQMVALMHCMLTLTFDNVLKFQSFSPTIFPPRLTPPSLCTLKAMLAIVERERAVVLNKAAMTAHLSLSLGRHRPVVILVFLISYIPIIFVALLPHSVRPGLLSLCPYMVTTAPNPFSSSLRLFLCCPLSHNTLFSTRKQRPTQTPFVPYLSVTQPHLYTDTVTRGCPIRDHL